ncbi:MAG: M28 family peptidase [Anaerolineae bacterium]|nr:M28 family peptidase [Anaerolineae bacterium]
MKRHRSLSWFAVIVLMVILTAPIGMAGAAPPQVASLPPEKTALVQVLVDAPEDLALFEQTSLPVYIRLEGEQGSYLLAGAAPAGLEALNAAGLPARVLDPDMTGATYYLAWPAPNRPRPEWSAYGQLLLGDGEQALLRTTPQDAERLAGLGVELRAVTLDPKPLRPSSPAGVLPTSITPDPMIQMMIDQVDQATVYDYTGGLSGEWPVDIGGAPYTIVTRHTTSGAPIQQATQFVYEHLEGLGLDVEYHYWSSGGYSGRNVIGERLGSMNPDNIFIICAHVDDMPSGPIAPGADDNASGTVAVLMAADILTQYQWGCTLRFALWTGEEQGLLGSHAYAQAAYNAGENIVGVLNFDMIAWDELYGPDIDLHADSDLPETLVLAQLFADVVDAYELNLIPEIIANGTGASDHASFWDYSYTAILGIEDYYPNYHDFNDYYHTVNDKLQYLNMPYYTQFVKAAVGAFAHMTGCLIPTGLGTLDGHVTAASGGAPIEGATVTAQNAAGNTFTDTTDATGYYTRTLLSGTYTVTAEAYGYLPATVTGVEVVTDTVTTLDIEMTALPEHTVSGYVRDAGTNAPLAATVEFLDAPVPPVTTDPATGFYTITVAEGTWTMQATAAQHVAQTAIVDVAGDVQQDFGLWPICDVFADDVENGNVGWTAQSPWAITTEASHSPTHSWTDSPGGNYSNNRNISLTSPVWDLADYAGLSLSFWHIYDTEPDYDFCRVEYSTNGGSTWTEAASWDGEDQTTWMYEEISLPQLDGQSNACIRFRFTSDTYQVADGWHVDDIVLTGGGPACVPAVAPVAEFTSNSPVMLGEPMAFTNQTTGTQQMEYLWDFGDGVGASTETDPSYVYTSTGSYTVTLVATNGVGSDTVQHAVVVLPSSCEGVSNAGFTWLPDPPLAGEGVVFTGVASGTAPIEFDWAFGDGTTGHGVVVTHTYAASDIYTVVLTATNACGEQVVEHDVAVLQPVVKYYIYLPIVPRAP